MSALSRCIARRRRPGLAGALGGGGRHADHLGRDGPRRAPGGSTARTDPASVRREAAAGTHPRVRQHRRVLLLPCGPLAAERSAPVALLVPGAGSTPEFLGRAFAGPLATLGLRLLAADLRDGDPDPAASLAVHAAATAPVVLGGVSHGAHLTAGLLARGPVPSVRALLAVMPAWTGRATDGGGGDRGHGGPAAARGARLRCWPGSTRTPLPRTRAGGSPTSCSRRGRPGARPGSPTTSSGSPPTRRRRRPSWPGSTRRSPWWRCARTRCTPRRWRTRGPPPPARRCSGCRSPRRARDVEALGRAAAEALRATGALRPRRARPARGRARRWSCPLCGCVLGGGVLRDLLGQLQRQRAALRHGLLAADDDDAAEGLLQGLGAGTVLARPPRSRARAGTSGARRRRRSGPAGARRCPRGRPRAPSRLSSDAVGPCRSPPTTRRSPRGRPRSHRGPRPRCRRSAGRRRRRPARGGPVAERGGDDRALAWSTSTRTSTPASTGTRRPPRSTRSTAGAASDRPRDPPGARRAAPRCAAAPRRRAASSTSSGSWCLVLATTEHGPTPRLDDGRRLPSGTGCGRAARPVDP